MKNTNPNTVLSKNKCNKILQNEKSLGFLLHGLELDMTCSFANKNNKIAKPSKYSIDLFFSTYISM